MHLRIIFNTNFSEDDKCYYPDAFLEGIKSYHGKLNSTTNGRDCVNWSDDRVVNHDDNFNPDIETNVIEDALLGDHNYCRNPDNDPNGPWCYTTDYRTKYDYCMIQEHFDISVIFLLWPYFMGHIKIKIWAIFQNEMTEM